MNKTAAKTIGMGILAGVTAALLVLGAGNQMSLIGVLLIYTASSLPILLVGLGWGNMAVLAAVLTGAAASALFVSPAFALAVTLASFAPAGWISHLANLARPASELGGPDHLLAWYPLSDILLQLCALQSVALVLVGFMNGYDPQQVRDVVGVLASTLATQQPEAAIDAAVIEQLKVVFPVMLMIAAGSLSVMTMFCAYYVGTRIVNASTRGQRPREDMPSSLRMNRNSIFVFLAGLAATFFGGAPATMGLVVLGCFGAGFLLAGFAAVHFRTRGKDWRLPALILLYITSFVITFPLFFVLIIGLLDTRKAIALTPVKDDPPPPTPSDQTS